MEEDPAGDDAAPPAPSGDERRLIGDYIRNHTREIRECYEKRLQERKTLQGKLVARFDIGPSGQVIGATDPVGYAAIERPIHPNDLHATILHALGINQHRLYYLHNNRKEKVTVNGGEVIREVFA